MALRYFFEKDCNRLQHIGVNMKMDDIAKLAGVSKASVSRVLNDKPNVSKKLRDRVEQVLKDYDYQPNLIAQALNTKKSKLIGVLLPAIGLDLFSDIVNGISTVLQQHGYELILADYSGSTERAKKNIDIFRSKQVDGIIYFPTDSSDEHMVYINQMKIPMVVLGHRPPLLEKKSVSFPDVAATKEIVTYFLKKGCKKITHVCMPKGHAVGKLREAAYREILAEHGLEPRVIYVDDISYESGYKLGSKLMDEEAVFVAMDRMAIGMMRYLIEENRLDDYLIAGIDNMEVSSMISPSLTTINFDYYHSGQLSGEMVLDIINGRAVASVVLPYELLERESTRR